MAALSDFDAYKESFKRFKKCQNLSGVLNLSSEVDIEAFKVQVKRLHSDCSRALSLQAHSLGLKEPSKWYLYTLPDVPGLVLIPNPFLEHGQHTWVKRCLVDYPKKPNMCNLDAHMQREGDGSVWPPQAPPRTATLTTPTKKQRLSHCDSHAAIKDSLLYGLRWVTLGYHYDWNSKTYHNDRRSVFPEDLALLAQFICCQSGFTKFRSEAAIVNYYHLNSTLSGHTDHSERDLSRPLLSISFGQSAIFLIGGQSKAVVPVPILLRSGDVVIMAGESRLAYHGVPKIIPPNSSQLKPPSCSQLKPPPNSSQLKPPDNSQLELPPDNNQLKPPDNSQLIPPGNSQPAPPNSSQPAPPNSSQPAPPNSSQPIPLNSSQPIPLSSSQPAPPNSSQPIPLSSSQPIPLSSSQPAPPNSSQPTPPNSSHLVPVSLCKETLMCSSRCPLCSDSTAGNGLSSVDSKQAEGSAVQCSGCVDDDSSASWNNFISYLSLSRINVNIRQVDAT